MRILKSLGPLLTADNALGSIRYDVWGLVIDSTVLLDCHTTAESFSIPSKACVEEWKGKRKEKVNEYQRKFLSFLCHGGRSLIHRRIVR